MKRVLFVLAFALVAASAHAQGVTPSNKLQWNEQAPDLATVEAYTFTYYQDGATTGLPLAPAVCTPFVSPDTSGFTCTVPFPAFTPGKHSITITASNVAGESPQSAPISFEMVLKPQTPTTLRIQ